MDPDDDKVVMEQSLIRSGVPSDTCQGHTIAR
jgi:hypothetical protein